jgi:hypothetical protein
LGQKSDFGEMRVGGCFARKRMGMYELDLFSTEFPQAGKLSKTGLKLP